MRYMTRREMNPGVFVDRKKDLALMLCYDTDGDYALGVLVKYKDLVNIDGNSSLDNVISYHFLEFGDMEEYSNYERDSFPFRLRQFFQVAAYNIAFNDIVPSEYHYTLQDIILTPLSVWDCEIRDVDEDVQYASIQRLQDETRELVYNEKEYKRWVLNKSQKTYFLS